MQSQVMGRLKNYQIAYSSFIHPFGKVTPLEYTCETYNDIVRKFSFKIQRKSELISERTNLGSNFFLKEIIVAHTRRDVLSHQLGFIEAFEKLYDISDSVSVMNNRMKIIITELERIIEHLTWFYELFLNSGIIQFNQIKNFRNKIKAILNQFFNIRGNDLSSCLEIGISHINWNEQSQIHFTAVLQSIYDQFLFLKDGILNNFKLKQLLMSVGIMDSTSALKTGTVGPIARASAIDQDLRIDDPYFDYLSLVEFKIAQSYDQDIYGLVKVLLNEIVVSFEAIRFILEQDFSPKPQNNISEADMSQSGQISVRLETSKGPTIYSIECSEKMVVKGYGMTTPGMVNLHSLEIRLRNVPTTHINRIIHAYNITELALFKS